MQLSIDCKLLVFQRDVHECLSFCISLQVPGTAESARSCVRAYFADLHETLCRQEEMALSVVDAHVRERLIWLRQQQEDMTILLSQVSTACLHCEKTLQQVSSTVAPERRGGETDWRHWLVPPLFLRTTAEWCWPSRRSTVCWRRFRSSSTSSQSWPTTFSWTPASPSPSPRYTHLDPGCVAATWSSLHSSFALSWWCSGQPGAHRSKDGDPGRDTGAGWCREDHHPL